MAFCNSCGSSLEHGAKFCAKCGAAQPASPMVSAASAPVSGVQPQSGNAVKVILIVVAVVVVLGILATGTAAFVAWRIARHTRVDANNGNVRVESPFGTVETNSNPDDIARGLGVELYPGARLQKGNSANITMAGMHTVSAEFESDDPVDKVAEFYKQRFPNANFSVADQGRQTIVSNDKKNLITINIESRDGKTRIQIASIRGKGVAGSTPN